MFYCIENTSSTVSGINVFVELFDYNNRFIYNINILNRVLDCFIVSFTGNSPTTLLFLLFLSPHPRTNKRNRFSNIRHAAKRFTTLNPIAPRNLKNEKYYSCCRYLFFLFSLFICNRKTMWHETRKSIATRVYFYFIILN